MNRDLWARRLSRMIGKGIFKDESWKEGKKEYLKCSNLVKRLVRDGHEVN